MKPIYKHLKAKHLEIIGCQLFQGNAFPGVAKGPNTLRMAGLHQVCTKYGWSLTDHADISLSTHPIPPLPHLICQKYPNKPNSNPTSQQPSNPFSAYKYAALVEHALEIGALNYHLFTKVLEVAKKKHFALVLGGDHSLATGSIPALHSVYPKLKVVWVDAHADINTPETSLSVHYHGMPLSHILGLTPQFSVPGFDWLPEARLRPQDLVYVGLRSVDPGEVRFLQELGIKHFDIDAVTDLGIGRVVREIGEYFAADAGRDYPLHCSFDIDGVDHRFVQQTGTVCRGGLTDREALFLVRKLAESGNLVSMDLVELNPDLGTKGERRERTMFHGDLQEVRATQTVGFCLDVVRAALGDRLCI